MSPLQIQSLQIKLAGKVIVMKGFIPSQNFKTIASQSDAV